MEPQVVHGPVPEAASGPSVVYQVTLGQGLVLTNPGSFGAGGGAGGAAATEAVPAEVIVAEDGRVLSPRPS